MLFVYSPNGEFIEMAQDDQHVIKGKPTDIFIDDSSCSTQEEFEDKYTFDGYTKTFYVEIDNTLNAHELIEVIEATKLQLINEIDTYAENKIIHGITIGDDTISASDTQMNTILFIIKSYEFGSISEFTIKDIYNNNIVISSIDEAKRLFTSLMDFRNGILKWQSSIVNDIKQLTSLVMIEQYQSKISFI